MTISILFAALMLAVSFATVVYLRKQRINNSVSGLTEKSETANEENTYLDHTLEEVMFRECSSSGLIYIKFYGREEQPDPIPFSHRLYHEAVTGYGDKISQEAYVEGKPARMMNQ